MRQIIIVFICGFMAMMSTHANSQHLFGNPPCADWHLWGTAEKTAWLNAFLVPLNLTNVARRKPKTDQFSLLTSLAPVVAHVDTFCKSNTDAMASVGAVQFLDDLTNNTQTK